MINCNAFEKRTVNGVAFYTIPFLEQTGLVRTAFSTRAGGVSTGGAGSMNLSYHRADIPENVAENYRRLLCAAGTAPQNAVVTRQVHGTDVLCAQRSHCGTGILQDEPRPEADALMTDERGIALVKHSADCGTIFLLDPVKKAIALAHSGWRGTLNDMAGSAVAALQSRYGTNPAHCLAAVAPSIGPCCFEVGQDVAELFAQAYPDWDLVKSGYEKPHVDLWACMENQLLRAGLQSKNICLSGMCTCCAPQEFHSHRYSKGDCGLMAGIFELI